MRVNESNAITREKLAHYTDLLRKRREIETELDTLKTDFNRYFDDYVGENMKGELTISDYKLQRQIRKTEKYEQETTVKRLEELNLNELIQKKPDEVKIKSALHLGLVKDKDLEGCVFVNTSQAIYVKQVDAN